MTPQGLTVCPWVRDTPEALVLVNSLRASPCRLATVRSGPGSEHSGQNLNTDYRVRSRDISNLDLNPEVQVQQGSVQVRTSVRS